MDLIKINRISKSFARFSVEPEFIYKELNKVSKYELEKTFNEYAKKRKQSGVDKVNATRAILADLIMKKGILNDGIVNNIKEEIQFNAKEKGNNSDIFHSWRPNWRILYPLYYNQYRTEVRNYFQMLTDRLRNDLKIKDITDVTIDDFNSPQHFGTSECWFAIFNKSHLSQKTAYQLFFILREGIIQYGLFKYKEIENTILNEIKINEYNYDIILEDFRKYLDIIRNNIATNDGRRVRVNRKGQKTVNIGDFFRKKIDSTKVTQKHKNIQAILLRNLEDIYNKPGESVELEKDFIDIIVEGRDFIELYEIKTNDKAIYCIRDAIGQLLLYASRTKLRNKENKKIKLIVVGLGEDNIDSLEFRNYLLENFNFDFDYLPFYLKI
jgi:hypothetical protein